MSVRYLFLIYNTRKVEEEKINKAKDLTRKSKSDLLLKTSVKRTAISISSFCNARTCVTVLQFKLLSCCKCCVNKFYINQFVNDLIVFNKYEKGKRFNFSNFIF